MVPYLRPHELRFQPSLGEVRLGLGALDYAWIGLDSIRPILVKNGSSELGLVKLDLD